MNKSKLYRRTCLVVACSLVALFVTLLTFFVVKKSTSVEYRLFYLEHELRYCIPDGTLKNEYSVGDTFLYTTDGKFKNQGKGWGEIGEDGCITHGNESDFYFYSENDDDLIMYLSLASGCNANYNVRINNSDSVASFVVTKESLCYSVPLLGNLFKEKNVNKISLSRLEGEDLHINNIVLTYVS